MGFWIWWIKRYTLWKLFIIYAIFMALFGFYLIWYLFPNGFLISLFVIIHAPLAGLVHIFISLSQDTFKEYLER